MVVGLTAGAAAASPTVREHVISIWHGIQHNMGLVAALCDHVVVLVRGRRFTEGKFADLRHDPRVQEAYMGHRV